MSIPAGQSGQSSGYSYPLGLFGGFGVELEYMIVDQASLSVRPVADALFRRVTGRDESDFLPAGPGGRFAWSNELALHVVEIKTNGPLASLEGVEAGLQSEVERINAELAPMGCRLMPTGMHPWMNPDREMQLWPHECTEVYQAYDRIFGCRGHGWANLQSTHINLPFGNDTEFGLLHAACRVALPLLPALAASSPLVEGVLSGSADHRMEVYRTNSSRVPAMAGMVVPEPVFTRESYEREVLGSIYSQLAPLDPEGVLRHEFANSRGCIARFDRGAIEIRVLDIQECPAADMAVLRLTGALVRALTEERWVDMTQLRLVPTTDLHTVLLATVRDAEHAIIRDPAILACLGLGPLPIRTGAVLEHLVTQLLPHDRAVAALIQAGSLSSRIRSRVGPSPARSTLRDVYQDLCDCLASGKMFRGN